MTTTLTKAERAAWAARLRDPAMKQARRTLVDLDRSMCCLGHGCEAMGRTITFEVAPRHDEHYSFMDGKTGGSNEDFIYMNDKRCLSLAEIADRVDQLPTCD